MALIITSGEPAGIGPDIILKAAMTEPLDAVVVADRDMILERARLLALPVEFVDYQSQDIVPKQRRLYVLHEPMAKSIKPGIPTPDNAAYILSQLQLATRTCLNKTFDGMVTAPVSKACINQAGIAFSGHTEYLAALTNTKEIVMMLVCDSMRVALVTTHLPLANVAKAITKEKIHSVMSLLLSSLQSQFSIENPCVYVAGLNPHAGEGGYLGSEEIDVIIPALHAFKENNVIGPLPADTMYSRENVAKADAFLAMYHDQGLSVLKYASFGHAVNVTLGLPMIRTSVDHGTAFSLAGTGKASEKSFLMAMKEAIRMRVQCELV